MTRYHSFALSLVFCVALVLVSACTTVDESGLQKELVQNPTPAVEKIIAANEELCEKENELDCVDIPIFVVGNSVTESKLRYEKRYEQSGRLFVYTAKKREYEDWVEYCSTAYGFATWEGELVVCEKVFKREADKNYIAWWLGHEVASLTTQSLSPDFVYWHDKCNLRKVKSKDLSQQDLENTQAALAESRRLDYYGFYFAVRAGYNPKGIARSYNLRSGYEYLANTSRCQDGGDIKLRTFNFIGKEIQHLIENDLPIVPQEHNFFEPYWKK